MTLSGTSEKTTEPWNQPKVERLRDELAELGPAFKLWQNKVLRAFAVCFVLLALLGGSVWWWFGYRHHREIQTISEEARHITKEKIRAQLLASVERTRQAALADAQKAKSWEERERLRQPAEKAYTGSISQIDELAASFAEIEGTVRSSEVFDEMTRILAEEGVNQALAYAATQRPGILEKVNRSEDHHSNLSSRGDSRSKQGRAFASRLSRDRSFLKEEKQRLCGYPRYQQEGAGGDSEHQERAEICDHQAAGARGVFLSLAACQGIGQDLGSRKILMHLVGVARADHGQLDTRNGLYQRGMKRLANKAKADESNTNGGFAYGHEKIAATIAELR